jgi:hypothetical protein
LQNILDVNIGCRLVHKLMPMAIKPNNAYPNLTTDYLADYTLGFTYTLCK